VVVVAVVGGQAVVVAVEEVRVVYFKPLVLLLPLVLL
jgi:hypothetical protein